VNAILDCCGAAEGFFALLTGLCAWVCRTKAKRLKWTDEPDEPESLLERARRAGKEPATAEEVAFFKMITGPAEDIPEEGYPITRHCTIHRPDVDVSSTAPPPSDTVPDLEDSQ
jgi:hypothetical protein